MKKLLVLIFTILAILSISKAQLTPCPDPCPTVPWQGPFPITCNVCLGATATCSFEYRCNTCETPSIPEFRIVGNITFVGNYSPSCTMDIILRELMICIIKQKIGLLSDCGAEDNLVSGFYTASCWKWGGLLPAPGQPMPPMITCAGTGCCLSHYVVTKLYDDQHNFLGYQVVFLNSRPYGPIQCDPNDPDCFFICGD